MNSCAQELRAAGLLTGLAGISSLDTLYQRGDIHPTMLDTVSYAGAVRGAGGRLGSRWLMRFFQCDE